MSDFRRGPQAGVSFHRAFTRRKPADLKRLKPGSMSDVDGEILERLIL
jgi:hypothetical protein